ncbi:MAG: hypothetical protein ACOVNY_03885 [Chitinophagaceae bacterium]
MDAKKKGTLDVIDKILNACYEANKDALFIMSLMHQYEERGWLTKKQMEGLLLKAKKVTDMPQGWLATLEANIAKMPTKDKTPIQVKPTENQQDTASISFISAILTKYPQHKRVLFFQSKIQNNTPLTILEKQELAKFHSLLIQ